MSWIGDAASSLNMREAIAWFLGTFATAVGTGIGTRAMIRVRRWNELAKKELAELERESLRPPPRLPTGATVSSDPHDAPTREYVVLGTELDKAAPTLKRKAENDAIEARRLYAFARDDLARKEQELERSEALRILAEQRASAAEEGREAREEYVGRLEHLVAEQAEKLNAIESGFTRVPLGRSQSSAVHAPIHVTEEDAAVTPARGTRALR